MCSVLFLFLTPQNRIKGNIEIRICLVCRKISDRPSTNKKVYNTFKDLKFVNLASELVFLIEKYRLPVFNFPSSRFREGTKGNIEIRILLVWLVCRTELIPEIMCY